MLIRFVPVIQDAPFSFSVIDECTVVINGALHSFPAGFVKFPSVELDSGGEVIDANRSGGVLSITIKRSCKDEIEWSRLCNPEFVGVPPCCTKD